MPPSHGKRALLIGINHYPRFAESYQLQGSVNDARAMADLLAGQLGFPQDDVEVLVDEEATRDGILAAMDRLVHRVGDNDVVVVHYSGHGSQVYRPQDPREADRYEETIVPCDSGRPPHPNRDVGCHEIYAWLRQLTAITSRVTQSSSN